LLVGNDTEEEPEGDKKKHQFSFKVNGNWDRGKRRLGIRGEESNNFCKLLLTIICSCPPSLSRVSHSTNPVKSLSMAHVVT
jgi:hypothetical protein